ncbi:LuxR C-terminal-related transcriptional regulator [Leifsonia sp. A12D58]|uniref:helix-turn-helix transcriptional regulator n=1 Tax=Leifsonia sp. A12D58 TaxID=3397674 RepID=UPI0039E1AD41
MVSGRFTPAYSVDRPGLRETLDGALTRPLTALIAQAGAGKSVLVTQWSNAHPEVPCVWMDMTDADDEPAHFARGLLSAIGTLGDGPRDPDALDALDALDTLEARTALGLTPECVSTLSAHLASLGTLVIVLDDLHHVSERGVRYLAQLVSAAPPSTHFIVTSRVDLRLAWGRNRLRSDVLELRQSDLAMTVDDSSQLVSRITGLELDRSSIEVLVERTEGWVAGLQLAAMTIRLRQDPTEFIAEFSGSDRLVADYLSEEVLHALPDDDRRSLLEMAVLDQLSAALIADLSLGPAGAAGAAGAALWARLDRESMFLIPLDSGREWFRFHRLFRDLLRYRLREEDGTAEPRILVRAAEWHLQRGETRPAVQYLLRAREWDLACDVILDYGSTAFENVDAAMVVKWITGIPERIRSPKIGIRLLHGSLTAASGSAVEAETILRAVAADPRRSIGESACAHAFLASLAEWRPNPSRSIDWAESALADLAMLGDAVLPNLLGLTDQDSLETIAMVSAGRAQFFAANPSIARNWLQRALSAPGAGHSIWRVAALGSLALIEAWHKNTSAASTLAAEALALSQQLSLREHPATADAFLATSIAANQRGDSTQAAFMLHEANVRITANGRTQLKWVACAAELSMNGARGSVDGRPLGPPPRVVANALLVVDAHMPAPAPALTETLTEREREVLVLLPTRLTNVELAGRYFVSVNTIKTHIAHIFRKLGVTNRGAAITRAMQLGLLHSREPELDVAAPAAARPRLLQR